jgi:predicted RNA-binding Zn-ribbon protein involved in translation (DUF1610 family)
MPTVIDCPTCSRKLRVTEELFGTQVKCPACGVLIDAPKNGAPELPNGNGPASGNGLNSPLSVQPVTPTDSPVKGATKQCPYCSEEIPVKAIRCKHCREYLDGDDRPWEGDYRDPVRRDCEPHRGTMVLIMGILGLVLGPIIGLGLGITAWMMGRRDLAKMRDGAMDPEGKGLTQAGHICGIIATAFQSVMLLFCLAYFGFVFYMVFSIRSVAPAPPAPPPPQWQQPKQIQPEDAPPEGRLRGIPDRLADYLPDAHA